MDIKSRHFIKASDVKKLVADLKERFGDSIDPLLGSKPRVERLVLENGEELFAINNTVSFWKREDQYVPLLKLLIDKVVELKAVAVDMGAVKFVTNGADVFRQGIRSIDPLIRAGDIVAVVDEKNHRPLAVTQALYDAEQMEGLGSGKALKNLHTINDFLWELSKEIMK
ncbi:MAG TPA: PUA domain-containing protein [Candidatus Lokiarchaeia archaeon]|nr:PUA domain-containing protein [Candidatus Lokiarchaeia archaeon]